MARILLIALLACAALAPAADAAGLAGTRRVLERQMRQAGPAAGAYVVDLDRGTRLYAEDADLRLVPASVEKLFTTSTALLRFGPDAQLWTGALATQTPDEVGVLTGDLYLRGGGDPSFGAAQAGELADELIAQSGLTEVTGRVIGDESAFDGLRGPPSSGYRTSIDVGPLSALSFDRGRTGRRRPYFQASPPLFAARAFERALGRRGVAVRRPARAGEAPPAAFALAEWGSPTVAELIERTNQPSDNFMAETLIKALGAEFGGAGSTAAGARVVRATLAGVGVRPRVVDGSGLSRADRTSPRQVVRLLSAMAENDDFLPFAESLAVAGRTGTLEDRMRRTAARDRCRGKTGTLSTVSALAGYCETRTGARLAFAFLMNGVNPFWARRLQDRMTAALARYSSGSPSEASVSLKKP